MTTNQIIKELGIEESDDSFRANILGNILVTADLRFAQVVDDVMTDDERAEFEEFSVGKGLQEISRWVENKFEGFGEMYAAIVESIVAGLKSRSQQTS